MRSDICGAGGWGRDRERLKCPCVWSFACDGFAASDLFTLWDAVAQIALVFMFIAPIVSLSVLCFVAMSYPIWARMLHQGMERPVVDTAGFIWEQAAA